MASFKDIKWAKLVIMLLSMVILNHSIVLPFIVSYSASSKFEISKNDAIIAHTLEDLFHLENEQSTEQEELPGESEEFGIEKNTEVLTFFNQKKEQLVAANLSLQFILYNNIAASLHQPELNTPPPKMA